MSELHDLHDLLANEANRGPSVAGPPFETIVARSRRRRVTQLVAVVGVVLVVTAAVVVPSVVGHHRTAAVAVGPAGATSQAARIAVTQQAADELVDGVQLPAGAVASPSAPTQAVAEAQGSPGSRNLVDATRFYTVPGTIDAVLAYVKAHPPTGTYANGTSTSSGPEGVELEGVMFGRIATHDYAAPTVWVMATQFGTGVAVRVDAYLVWRPLRTVAEVVPADVSSANVTAQCLAGEKCPLGVLSTQDARELAAFFNSLDTQVPTDNYGGCENGTLFNGASHITFEVPGGSVTFSPTCGGVTVTANGVAQPTLDTTDVAMDPQLQHLLGLSNAPSGSSPAPVGAGFSAPAAVASAAASAAASSGPP